MHAAYAVQTPRGTNQRRKVAAFQTKTVFWCTFSTRCRQPECIHQHSVDDTWCRQQRSADILARWERVRRSRAVNKSRLYAYNYKYTNECRWRLNARSPKRKPLPNYTVSQKKQDTLLMSITSRNNNGFSKCFHC